MTQIAIYNELKGTLSTVLKECEALKQECVTALGYDPTAATSGAGHLPQEPINLEAGLRPSTQMLQSPSRNAALHTDHTNQPSTQPGNHKLDDTIALSDDEADAIPLAKRQRMLWEAASTAKRHKTGPSPRSVSAATDRTRSSEAGTTLLTGDPQGQTAGKSTEAEDEEEVVIIEGSGDGMGCQSPTHLPGNAAGLDSDLPHSDDAVEEDVIEINSDDSGSEGEENVSEGAGEAVEIYSSEEEEPVIVEERPPPRKPPSTAATAAAATKLKGPLRHTCSPASEQHQRTKQHQRPLRNAPSTGLPGKQTATAARGTTTSAVRRGAGRSFPASSHQFSYGFTDPEAARQFKRSFTSGGAYSGISSGLGHRKSASTFNLEKEVRDKAKEIYSSMAAKSVTDVKKDKAAWAQAAMAWRQKNMPSAPELNKKKMEAAAAAAARQVQMNNNTNPRQRFGTAAAAGSAPARGMTTRSGSQAGPKYPGPNASEADKRAYYRAINQVKVQNAGSFVQVLRIFKVPCADASKVKDAWRVAVRMYHPDSNSRDKVWQNDEQKMESEEIMKLINERRPEKF